MKKIGIGLFVLVLIAWMLKDTFKSSGIDQLKGGFTEVAKYRNENNTGPVQRIYAVTVSDTTHAELLKYGNAMPHTKYGNTKVYFFLHMNDTPKKLYPGKVNFETQFNNLCYARYEKSAMGNVGLVKWPYR
jgi:hypothetical protein